MLSLDKRKEVSDHGMLVVKCVLKYVDIVRCSQLEGIPDSVSEQGMRKGLYQKVWRVWYAVRLYIVLMLALQIIAVFPEGWMTSGNISRDSMSSHGIIRIHLLTHVMLCSLRHQEKARERTQSIRRHERVMIIPPLCNLYLVTFLSARFRYFVILLYWYVVLERVRGPRIIIGRL